MLEVIGIIVAYLLVGTFAGCAIMVYIIRDQPGEEFSPLFTAGVIIMWPIMGVVVGAVALGKFVRSKAYQYARRE